MLRIGMIGSGQIADTHAANLARIEGVRVAGALDTVSERASAFVASHGGRAYTEIDDLLAESDAIYVCTPPRFHREAVVRAAQAGVHVFCEKPLSVSVEDAHEMEAAVSKSGITCMVGFNMRFSPAFPDIKSMCENREFGNILLFWCTRMVWLPHLAPNWRTDPQFICGMTIESLSHDFDFLHWIGGDVDSVMGQVGTSRPDLIGYDNIMSATMNMRSGAMASFHSTWASHVHVAQYGIVGTHASAVFDWGQIRIKSEAESSERLLEFKRPEDKISSHQRETEYFIACLKSGQPPIAGVRDGVATVLISNALLRSAELQRAVSLTEISALEPHRAEWSEAKLNYVAAK
jgi:predicted dehydrogenase